MSIIKNMILLTMELLRNVRGVMFVILMWFACVCVVHAQSYMDVKFERLTVMNGLSNNQINAFYEDHDGFIWVGTLSGLNRFDGYEVKQYFHQNDDTTSLPNNTVLWISEGPEGNMWVKSPEGLAIYNHYEDLFLSPQNYMSMLQTTEVFISQMLKDASGAVWFAIENRGIEVLLPSGQLISLSALEDADISLSSNAVSDIILGPDQAVWVIHTNGIIEQIDLSSFSVSKKLVLPESLTNVERHYNFFVDRDGDFWLYSQDVPFGMYYLNVKTGFSRIFDKELVSNVVRELIQTENGDLWIGLDHGGVAVINKKSMRVSPILNDPDQPKSLVSNNVSHVFLSSNQIVWVSTAKSGLCYYRPGANNFSHLKINKKDQPYNDMSSFAEDNHGNLWIGTNGKSLLYLDRNKNKLQSVLDWGVAGPVPDVIVSLASTAEGTIWVGSYLEGLFRFNGKRFESVNFTGAKMSGLSIWDLYVDSKGFLWIGTLNRGLYKYDVKSGEVKAYNMSNILSSNYITTLAEDAMGDLWIGSGVGLMRLNPETEEVKLYETSRDETPYQLNDNNILSVYCDARGKIWVATLDGLHRYRADIDGFDLFTEKDGLSSNIVMAVMEDEHGSIWMSTSNGISKITENDTANIVQTFDMTDGLQGMSFTEDAAFKTSDGYLIFSGQNGMNFFRPDDVEVNMHVPRLMLVNMYVGGEKLIPQEEFNGRVVLDRDINDSEQLMLKHAENSVAFDFVAFSYFQSGKIKYQYQLEGFDRNWVTTTAESRKANYTNLDYGDYTFKVRCSNGPNTWSDQEIMLKIHISPPFWETSWAYLVYVILVGVLLFFVRNFIVKRERAKAREENDRREVERQHELDLMKIKFFTNISHEFRTPLSLILTPIERMIKHTDQIKTSNLTIIHRNAQRLMNLVNQLLDFRKMEANQHTLNQSSGNIVAFFQDIIDSFADMSREKDVKLIFQTDVKKYYTLFDRDKMEKVMFNLLSNAFKFTLPGGEISVNFELIDEEAGKRGMITVSDTGIGIPEDKQQLIFNRFFQNEVTGYIINNGTGIGLSITKEFVELHKGTIKVESEPDVGSTFIVELPLNHIKGAENANDITEEVVMEEVAEDPTAKFDKELPFVFIVDDNADFRFYLKDNLKQYYNVLEAANGKDAWKMIRQNMPDIVVSDVMMPIMDGRELCEKIKSDPRTLHIPVILLTAQNSDKHKIEGLESGAIDYISKPFNFEILISTINSALKFQKRVNEAKNMIKVEPSQINIVSMDEKLISKAIELVEANMSNSDFTVETLSHELGYSRGHFYQKILKLTGQTPMDFIRNIRMKRASELLKKSQMNVSEVAYKVGYNNPKLFSRYFKTQFQMYPSEFRNRAAKGELPEEV